MAAPYNIKQRFTTGWLPPTTSNKDLQLDGCHLQHQTKIYSWMAATYNIKQRSTTGQLPPTTSNKDLQLDGCPLQHQTKIYSWMASPYNIKQRSTTGWLPPTTSNKDLQLDSCPLQHLTKIHNCLIAIYNTKPTFSTISSNLQPRDFLLNIPPFSLLVREEIRLLLPKLFVMLNFWHTWLPVRGIQYADQG